MTDDIARLSALLAAGIGLVAAAVGNLLVGRAGGWRRAAATAVPAGLAAALVTAMGGGPAGVGTAAGVFAAGVLLVAVLGSDWLRRAAVRWGLAASAGVGAVAWALASADGGPAELELLAGQVAGPPPTAAVATSATTDRGTPVPLAEPVAPRTAAEMRVYEDDAILTPRRGGCIRRQPADDRANCHGWVFTGGRYWMSGAAVATVLAENGYAPTTDPRPGDLIVYRTGAELTHSGIVRYTAPGMPVMVEGKWGSAGVYLHPVDDSMYGSDYTYYRAARDGHLLAGLGGPSPSAPAEEDPAAPKAEAIGGGGW